MNFDPLPTLDSTIISPPRAYAMFLLIVRPSPTPCLFISLLSKIFVNGENNFFNYSSSIPTPLSSTIIFIVSVNDSL
jgi:hypothetical protein